MSAPSAADAADLFPRAGGVLLHPTSLPGPHGCGDIGGAHHFVDWLAAAGQRLWQTLPLTEIGRGDSPYMSPSAFAGNRLMIDLAELARQGWLHPDELEPCASASPRTIDYAAAMGYRMAHLARANERFLATGSSAQHTAFEAFCEAESGWLDDYALFMAIDETQPGRYWSDWEADLAGRDPGALADARRRLADRIALWKFCQWNFHRQWRELLEHAHDRGLRLFGDAPIFVAYHSADVWAHPELFELDEDGRQRVVAGVPPDYFSASGQLWGNPLYRWDRHREQGFRWWLDRIENNFALADVMRIDHFIGFVNYWEIPAGAETAIDGRWVDGPGRALFDALRAEAGRLAIVAENLGIVTPAVEALRRELGFPGMAVLQFAWSGDADNPHLPERQEANCVVYTATHDNDTSAGWWQALDDSTRAYVRRHIDIDDAAPQDGLIRAALASPAHTAIVPLQDYLGLDSRHRMNTPGQAEGNWRWRALESELDERLAADMAALGAAHDR